MAQGKGNLVSLIRTKCCNGCRAWLDKDRETGTIFERQSQDGRGVMSQFVDPDGGQGLSAEDAEDALMRACKGPVKRHADVAALLKQGVDCNTPEKEGGLTALSHASYDGDLKMVNLLLQKGKGIDVEKKNDHGLTPLMLACHQGHTAVVGALLVGGATIESRDKDGWNPMIIAANSGHAATVKGLLEAGANPDQSSTGEMQTALMLAAQNGDNLTVRMLLSGGADPECVDVDGMTALMICAQDGNLEMVEVLTQKGVQLEAANKEVSDAVDPGYRGSWMPCWAIGKPYSLQAGH
jgi:serine/threonine-protein phosphatase 6 regulatory ankyrin repeat subunit B